MADRICKNGHCATVGQVCRECRRAVSQRNYAKNRVASMAHTRAWYARHPEYHCWQSMVKRCSSPANIEFARYGDRGITVCERWKSYVNFRMDMGPRPSPQHSIERRDNNAGYEPGNCYWATKSAQARNRRSSRMLVYSGRTMCVAAWAEEVGIKSTTLRERLDRYGWSVHDALSIPTGRGR